MSTDPSPSPGRGPSRLGRLLQPIQDLGSHRWVEAVASRPRLVIGLTGVAAFSGCVLFALLNGIPQPAVHDEFSYLLAGDTFASSRLTNPTHPMWRHFESFHIIQQPTYASKYPPGQGAFLALGQILGHPILGVWISVALMAMAISWMLYQWVPPKWALLGSVLALVQVGFPTYWGQSYWGGAVAALGGALVFGGLRAAADEPRLRHGMLFGLGAMLLATTRPLEGMLAGLPTAVVMVGLLLTRRGKDRAQFALGVFVPAVTVVVATALALSFYNERVTGNPLQMPYQVYNETYHLGAQFPWQTPSPVMDYRHEALLDYKRTWILERAETQRQHFSLALLFKFLRLQGFLLGPGLLALMALPAGTGQRWILLPVVSSAAVIGGDMLTKGAYPHYAAPAAAPLLILILDGLRRLSGIRKRHIYGPTLVALIILAYLPYLALRRSSLSGPETVAFGKERHRVLERLLSTDGDDLVIVRYRNGHNFHREWVYNRAVIASADVIWARDMTPEENHELIQTFTGRRAWLLEVNGSARLRPYPEDPS